MNPIFNQRDYPLTWVPNDDGGAIGIENDNITEEFKQTILLLIAAGFFKLEGL